MFSKFCKIVLIVNPFTLQYFLLRWQEMLFHLMTGEADVYERVELLLVVEPGDSNILIKLHEAKQLKRYSNYDSFFFQ